MLARVTRFFANPLLVKELRAGARGARFFYAHLAVLAIFAIIFLLIAGAMIADAMYQRRDPSRVGEMLFGITQAIQMVGVFLIVPAFAATAISGERERQTFDLLTSTTLTPARIAWGKLTASLIQAGLIFLSLLPLVSLSFMFGGVTVWQLLVNTFVMAVVATLLSSWALSISASVRSTTRAVIGVYAGSILLAILLCLVGAMLAEAGVLHHFMRAYGFMGSTTYETVRSYGRSTPYSPLQTWLYIAICPSVIAAGIVTFFMINTTNKLKPFFAERTAALRTFYVGAMTTLILLSYLCFMTDIRGSTQAEWAFFVTIVNVMLVAFSVSAVFSCEDPVLPRYLSEQVAALPARKWWRRLMAPGAVAGARFALAANLVLLTGLYALFAPHTAVFADPRFEVMTAEGGAACWKPWLLCVGIILLWTFMLSGAGMLFGVIFRRHSKLSRVLLFSLALLASVVPIVYWAIVQSLEVRRGGTDVAAPWELAFSPIAAILSALHGPQVQSPYETSLFGLRFPLPLLYAVTMLVIGTSARLFAWKRLRALREEE